MIHISDSQASIDFLFEFPAKLQGAGWDKAVNLRQKAIAQRIYRQRTAYEADRRYARSEKGRAAKMRYKNSAKGKAWRAAYKAKKRTLHTHA